MMKLMLFAGAFAIAQAGATAAMPVTEVFDDIRAVCVCVIGAMVGAFLAIAVFPPRDDTEENKVRRLSLKFGSSMFSGIVFTPAIMQHVGLAKSADYLMGISAFVAIFAVTALHVAAPKIERIIGRIK